MLSLSLLQTKIPGQTFQELIGRYSQTFSAGEMALLNEIIEKFEFDSLQSQALVQAVLQQSRFDPNAQHIDLSDDEDGAAICQHCLQPPVPPLRDYAMWREKQSQEA